MPITRFLVCLAVLLLTVGCSDVCPDGACDELPEDPWTPPDGDDDDATGNYGDDDDDDTADDDTWGDDDTTPVIEDVRDCVSHLEYTPDSGSPSTVTVAGEWNGFDPGADPMADNDGDGVWTFDVELEPGEYAYKYVVDGEWEGSPPPNRYTKWYGTSENRNLRVGDCTVPLLQTESTSVDGSGNLDVVIQVALGTDETPLDTGSVIVTVGGDDHSGQTSATEGGSIELHLGGLEPGKHSVRVWAADQAGRRAENEPLFIPLWVEDESFEWVDATMYFAFTDRFRNGDWDADPPMFGPVDGVEDLANYRGGDFLGIVDAMQMNDYFTDLGVNLLWISPVYENPDDGYVGDDGHMYSGYHGYWPVLARTPESRFGDVDGDAEDRLAELIDEAHSRGIRVLLDLVLNHVHEDHEYVGQHSDWFEGGGCVCGEADCGWDDHAVDCWFRDYLPDLDYTNHEIVMQQVDDVLWWAQEYDVDAFRVDAAKHMNHVIMRTLSMRLRDEFEMGGGAPFYLVGETYTFTDGHDLIMDYVADYELDGQFDFPLVWTIRDVFAGWSSFSDLENQVSTGEYHYGDAVMSAFLGNHDILRYSTYLAGNYNGYDDWDQPEDLMAAGSMDEVDQWDIINKMSMGFCFVLTQKGVPLIYYGDEIGLAGNGDPDNRRNMSFDPYLNANQSELLSRIQAIGQARQDSTPLRRGTRSQLFVDDDLYVYARDAGNGDVAIVAMNKGGSRSESVSIPGDLGIDGQTLDNAVGSGSISVSGGAATISLGSWEYAIYLP